MRAVRDITHVSANDRGVAIPLPAGALGRVGFVAFAGLLVEVDHPRLSLTCGGRTADVGHMPTTGSLAVGFALALLLSGCGKANRSFQGEAQLFAEANALCKKASAYVHGKRPSQAERRVIARLKIVGKHLRQTDGGIPAARDSHEAEAKLDVLVNQSVTDRASLTREKHLEARINRDKKALGLGACVGPPHYEIKRVEGTRLPKE
jgi:hypothetical protein